MPHQLIRRKKTVKNYTRPYSENPVSSRWDGALRLAYYLIAFYVSKQTMQLAARRGVVFVMDRSFADFVADLSRARIPARGLPGWLLDACTPRGCLIYLDVCPSTLVQRKGELTLGKAMDLRERYFALFTRIGGQVIDGDGSPIEVYTRILKCIDAVYYERLCNVAAI